MRARFPSTVLLLVLVAAPLQAQERVCAPEAAPEIASLFPDEVEGLQRAFYRMENGAETHLYRGPAPWVALTIAPNRDPFLGTEAEALESHYERKDVEWFRVLEWPVAVVDQDELGQEYIALRGPVRITVLVKDAATDEARRDRAETFLERVFLLLPCELGTY